MRAGVETGGVKGLALVRFQPKSVDGMHISPVVLANFIQTVPRRSVEYDTSQLGTTGTVRVQVEGPAYVRNQNDPGSVPQMILRLEKRSALGATRTQPGSSER